MKMAKTDTVYKIERTKQLLGSFDIYKQQSVLPMSRIVNQPSLMSTRSLSEAARSSTCARMPCKAFAFSEL